MSILSIINTIAQPFIAKCLTGMETTAIKTLIVSNPNLRSKKLPVEFKGFSWAQRYEINQNKMGDALIPIKV